MQAFGDIADWLKEATGAEMESVSLEEFRKRISSAVEEKGSESGGVLAQVCASWIFVVFVVNGDGDRDVA